MTWPDLHQTFVITCLDPNFSSYDDCITYFQILSNKSAIDSRSIATKNLLGLVKTLELIFTAVEGQNKQSLDQTLWDCYSEMMRLL